MEAEKAGLQRGDILVSVDGKLVRSTPKLHEIIDAGNGKPVSLVYARNGERHTITIAPARSNIDGTMRWMIGVQLQPRLVVVKLSLPDALVESARRNLKGATLIYKFLQELVLRRMSPKSLEGPIRIAQLSGEAAREGASAFFELMSMVSLNLAIFNLLPIPILDGGVILMLVVEMFMRRDLSLRVKEAVFQLGFVFLMAVVVFVLYNDITKILPAG
jgi:regulator of sigma E protease